MIHCQSGLPHKCTRSEAKSSEHFSHLLLCCITDSSLNSDESQAPAAQVVERHCNDLAKAAQAVQTAPAHWASCRNA